jgi:hypothetical protein
VLQDIAHITLRTISMGRDESTLAPAVGSLLIVISTGATSRVHVLLRDWRGGITMMKILARALYSILTWSRRGHGNVLSWLLVLVQVLVQVQVQVRIQAYCVIQGGGLVTQGEVWISLFLH